ncbi:MAG: NAD(P)H-dependent oxidoreductase subunit E [Candidatus Cloacimonetes bacterium]|nr:NAD(P)H-dependent oxidoreductase subunit E [Candidatus Cloacimonadota bacterium]
MSHNVGNDTKAQYEELKKIIDEMKGLSNPLIEVLHKAQEIFGYLPPEVQHFVADELDVPVSQVFGVVTFYNFFSMKPRGKHMINVCMGTACFVKGAPKLMDMLSNELSINVGETTNDGVFTLNAVRCVGACSLAPIFVVDEESYGKIDTQDRLKEIITQYRANA